MESLCCQKNWLSKTPVLQSKGAENTEALCEPIFFLIFSIHRKHFKQYFGEKLLHSVG